MKQRAISRREFAGASASLSALSWSSLIRAASPLSRLRVGVIGTGVRGKYLIGNLPENARVVALCDCATSRVAGTLSPKQEFAEVLAGFCQRDSGACKSYQDYRRMLDREPLDAVIIATPDHHHVQAAMLALHAGLDVYLEKPLSLTIREGRLLADLVKSTGRVLQVGSQQRTMELNRFACEFIRDGGLGKVKRVDCPNYPGPIAESGFNSEPIPEELQWELFLGPSSFRPHNRKLWVKDKFKVDQRLWRGWDLFRDYSGHLMTNWGAHNVDMVQYALGMDHCGPVNIAPLDVSEAALERDWRKKWYNKTPRPEGRFSQASRFQPVTMEYADGTTLNFLPDVPTATFYGEHGSMKISRNRFVTDPPDLIRNAPDPAIADRWKGSGFVARPHLQNWIDCMETRRPTNAPAEVGHRSVTVCHLANLVREVNRPLKWNPVEERFVDDEEANALLNRPRRKGFELPVPTGQDE
ncbi:Glucose--fructose oxidoreductase precursor [Stieleria maiorica]|uniref:Glucose--fructose oxidoreductase n=1 Tax=Stieleria maiorica TaxID=2795974 RepID=A0A5B9MCD6_9BACT|nr:Gfo/Idh/MocA family oxidoreductase [Stieleria maiorica]QEF96887.1 Glucose--fructose oxidoreductase precursor [Stieleria maiorica]